MLSKDKKDDEIKTLNKEHGNLETENSKLKVGKYVL